MARTSPRDRQPFQLSWAGTGELRRDILWTELDADGNGTDYQVLAGDSLPQLG